MTDFVVIDIETTGLSHQQGARITEIGALRTREGIVVDTHVGRLAVRLGLTNKTNSKDAINIEKDLMKIFSKNIWLKIHLLLIFHGRAICTAKNPNCIKCKILKICI